MSCYSFVHKYTNENETQNEDILNEAINCLQNREAIRTQDLYEFIDDFINSREYLDYVEAKKTIIKRPAATQCDENDIIVEVMQKTLIDKYPLTEERRKMYAFKEQFEKYAETQSKLNERKKQERCIQIIKEKINTAKTLFECTRESKQRKKVKRDERILHYYSSKLGTNFSEFSTKSRSKILERVRAHQRVVCARKKKKRQNILNILEKLLFEYKLEKDVAKFQNKTYDYKVKRQEKIIKDMEVLGIKIELIDTQKLSIATEEAKIEEPQPVTKEKHEKLKKNDKEKDKKEKEKRERIPTDKKPAKDKKVKGKAKEKVDAKLEMPFVPLVNPREKITSENIDQMLDLVDEFRKLDSELENRDMLKERNAQNILGATGIAAKPNTILFQNYDVGKTYYKTIVLSNVSSRIRKIRFLKFSFRNEYDEVAFDIEPFGIQKIFTGCGLKFWLSFQPYDSLRCYEGTVLFLSYDIRTCEYYKHVIGVKCVPKYSGLQVFPKTVDFGRMPVWKAKSFQGYKVLKFVNKCAGPCTIYIHKIRDPLDIESILTEDENKENVEPSISMKNSLTSVDEDTEFIEDIINLCIDNVDNNFYFEETFLTLDKFEERRLKVFFKNADYIGNYFEKFTVDVYERGQNQNIEVLGCQEISLFLETTDHFLSVSPTILDFGVCQINSCYQLNFEMLNTSNVMQALSMRFPSNIGDLIDADISTVYLPPQGKRVMWFKLIPRDYVFKDACIYFDKSTSILEFPIHLYPVSKSSRDYPPFKLPVYAILSNTEDITIMTNGDFSLNNFLDTILMDIKTCSIYETIWTDISLTNNTLVTQVCGFLDLPQCVTLEPNQGFVKLYPNQEKKIRLHISPEVRDFPSFAFGTLKHNRYFFKLQVETISNIGKIKKEIPLKKLKASLDLMLKELYKKDSQELSILEIMIDLQQSVANEISNSMLLDKRNVSSTVKIEESTDDSKVELPYTKSVEENNMRSFDDTLLNFRNFVILDTTSRKAIWCKVSLNRPLLEFSHQTIEFPDTPCGSYSVMEIRLRAVDKPMEVQCEVTKKTKRRKLDYAATFEISGNSQEISVEPKCGTLRPGESVKITFLARPGVPQEIVDQTARSIKYSEIYELKLKEFQNQQTKRRKETKVNKGKQKVKGKKKDKSTITKQDSKSKKNEDGKKKNAKKSVAHEDDKEHGLEEVPNFVITDKELEYDFLDLYPAEMVYWRNMEPYFIMAKFTCCICYLEEPKIHTNDWLYLNAICKVIRPDFISNLNLQRIDFGKCVIGTTTTKEIMLQNIKYDDIEVKTTLLNPVGYFSVPFIKDLRVPPEHSLKLPIDFTPTSTNQVTEYLEITSNGTILPLILCGEGVEPVINITPDFAVFRLERKQNQLAELQLKIENLSESQVKIRIEKLFEIEGRMGHQDKQKPDVKKDANLKTGKKEKKTKSLKAQAKDKGPKYSEYLTDHELESIDVDFNRIKGESHFVLNNTDKYIQIPANTSDTLIIFFGEPEVLKNTNLEKPKKRKKEKDKTNKAGKNLESNKSGDGGKQYITQYNMYVGRTYLKSIILVCTNLY